MTREESNQIALDKYFGLNKQQKKTIRVKSIIELILSRKQFSKRRLAEQWGVDYATIHRDMIVANEKIVEYSEVDVRKEFGKILRNYDRIYSKAFEKGDLKSCLTVLDALSRLFNLHSPLQINLSGKLKIENVPIAEQQLELKNALLEAINGQPTRNN